MRCFKTFLLFTFLFHCSLLAALNNAEDRAIYKSAFSLATKLLKHDKKSAKGKMLVSFLLWMDATDGKLQQLQANLANDVNISATGNSHVGELSQLIIKRYMTLPKGADRDLYIFVAAKMDPYNKAAQLLFNTVRAGFSKEPTIKFMIARSSKPNVPEIEGGARPVLRPDKEPERKNDPILDDKVVEVEDQIVPKELLPPNSEVLEVAPLIRPSDQDLYYRWLKAEYWKVEFHDPDNVNLKAKILAMSQVLVSNHDFIDMFMQIFYKKKLIVSDSDKNDIINNRLKSIEKIKQFATSQKTDHKRIAWYLYDLLAETGDKNALNIKSSLPSGNWAFLINNLPIKDMRFRTSRNPDPKLIIKPLNDKLVVAEQYKNKTRQPVKKEAFVNGLIVMSLPNSKSIGQPSRIMARVINSANTGRVYLTEKTGLNMQRSLSNATLALNKRFPIKSNSSIQVSFDSTRAHKDGNSAGVAFTLLLFSLYEGIQLDDNVAVTGVILPDGGVKAVGGVPSKVRGAQKRDIPIVIIPKENRMAVDDMTILYDIGTIWRTQIFSVSNFTEVLKVAPLKKKEKYQKAIKKFNALVPILNGGNKSIIKNKARLIKEVKEILELTPNHESARVLNTLLTGKRPGKLSIFASVDQIFMISERTLQLSVGQVYESSEESLKNSASFLTRTQSLMDPKVIPFSIALKRYIDSLIKFRKLAVLNLHKGTDNVGTALNFMNTEQDKMEKTRQELNIIWKSLSKKMR